LQRLRSFAPPDGRGRPSLHGGHTEAPFTAASRIPALAYFKMGCRSQLRSRSAGELAAAAELRSAGRTRASVPPWWHTEAPFTAASRIPPWLTSRWDVEVSFFPGREEIFVGSGGAVRARSRSAGELAAAAELRSAGRTRASVPPWRHTEVLSLQGSGTEQPSPNIEIYYPSAHFVTR
jgi:hypothetical protein